MHTAYNLRARASEVALCKTLARLGLVRTADLHEVPDGPVPLRPARQPGPVRCGGVCLAGERVRRPPPLLPGVGGALHGETGPTKSTDARDLRGGGADRPARAVWSG